MSSHNLRQKGVEKATSEKSSGKQPESSPPSDEPTDPYANSPALNYALNKFIEAMNKNSVDLENKMSDITTRLEKLEAKNDEKQEEYVASSSTAEQKPIMSDVPAPHQNSMAIVQPEQVQQTSSAPRKLLHPASLPRIISSGHHQILIFTSGSILYPFRLGIDDIYQSQKHGISSAFAQAGFRKIPRPPSASTCATTAVSGQSILG